MSEQPKMGQLLDDTAERDAVHVAIAPIIAAGRLMPGAHVGLDAEGRATTMATHVGVVDPFLRSDVEEGQRFFLFLYPQTITSLRHQWSHPSFPEEARRDKRASERWLQRWCEDHGGDFDYDDLMIMMRRAADDGEFWDHTGTGISVDEEVFDHAEVVLGRKIERRTTYFSCAC